MKRILVVSPHPDDEAIGCGGSLRKHVLDGAAVFTVFLTSGENGGHGTSADETLRVREREAHEAGRILGLSRLEFWREPDGGLRAGKSVVDRMRETIDAFDPDVIYVTHDGEMHPDHRAAARIVRRALLAQSAAGREIEVRMYEVWTPLQRMDVIVDISTSIEAKKAAIRAHASQCHVVDFDEAALGLNRYRGALHSWPGGDYAEVFVHMRLRRPQG